MNVYQLTKNQILLNELLEESYGEITPEIETLLKITKENFAFQCENMAVGIKSIESDIEAAETEIKRLNDLKKRKEKSIEKMKESLKASFNLFGVQKQVAGLYTLALRKSESVEIIDETKVPAQFKTVETVEKISKKDLKEYLETIEGSETDFARIKENQNINIK